MLFFAIVYVVEGIGQARVGIIFQPLNFYLKDIGWTPVQVTAYLAILNFPWIIKPVFGLVSDFIPLFGYRRKSYLIISSICAIGAYAWIARLSEPGEFALLLVLTSYAMATASTLCGALLAENGQSFRLSGAFVGQQWLWFYIAIMASSFVGGELVQRLSPLSALQAAAGVAAVAPIAVILATLFLLSETKGHGQSTGNATHVSESRHGAEVDETVPGRLLPVSVFLRPGLWHAALLLHDRRAQILPVLHRHSGLDRLGGLDRGRPGASLASPEDAVEDAVVSQHRVRNARPLPRSCCSRTRSPRRS